MACLPKAPPAPAPAQVRQTRPPLARMLRIHEALQAENALSRQQLASDLEVTTKTVQRDIDFMRDQMGLPIGYVKGTGFRYTEEVTQFPSIQITEGELVALCIARRALESYRGTNFEPALRSAFHKLTAELRDELSFNWTDLDDAFSFRAMGFEAVTDLVIFETVTAAVLSRAELSFIYCKPAGRGEETRTVRPLHVRCEDNAWYLFAYDLARKAIRTFALTRMRELHHTGTTFELKEPFRPEEHLQHGFGIFGGSKAEQVRLRFSAATAQLVRERRWHRSQNLTEGADGSVELTLQVAITPEVERWVLGWGADVEVLGPAGLRERIAEVAMQVARRNGSVHSEIAYEVGVV